MIETVRDTLIYLGLIIILIGSFWLVAHAFRENFFWGMATLISIPFACCVGLLFGAMHYYASSRPLLVTLSGLGLFSFSLFFFPREPITGYWINPDNQTVFYMSEERQLRNYELEGDSKWDYRPFRVFNRDLPILSQTRIMVIGHSEFELAYYYPKKDEITFYDENNDPEQISIARSLNEPNTFIRIRNVDNQDFLTLLAHFERREIVKQTFDNMLNDIKNGRNALHYVSSEVIRKYSNIAQFVVAAKREDILKLPKHEQSYIHHLRSSHSQLLTGGRISTMALIHVEMQCNFFGLKNLPEDSLQDVLLEDNGLKGFVILAVGREYSRVYMPIQNLDGKGWKFDVDAIREMLLNSI